MTWRKLHFFDFTWRSARKSSRLFLTSDGSWCVSSKDLHLDQSHASPPSTALEWWREDLDLDRTIPHSQKQQSSWSCCQPWWQSRRCATVFWDSSFVWEWGRNWRLGNGVTVMVVSQGLGKASWTEGGWNGSRAARRRIKDLAWSEMGVQYKL